MKTKILPGNKESLNIQLRNDCSGNIIFYLLLFVVFFYDNTITCANVPSQNLIPFITMSNTDDSENKNESICQATNLSDTNSLSLSGSIITGYAHFSKYKVTRFCEFRSNIFFDVVKFDSCRFNEKVLFDKTFFNGNKVLFEHCCFKKDLDFKDIVFNNLQVNHSIFSSDVKIDNSKFEGITKFSGAEFYKQLEILNDTFSDQVIFEHVNIENATVKYSFFKNTIDFINCHFDGKIVFQKLHFNDIIKFSNLSKFNEVYFTDVHFGSHVEWIRVTFNEPVTYNRTTFNGNVKFSDSASTNNPVKFKKKVSFQNSVFKAPVQFSNVVFHSTVDFSKGNEFHSPVTFYQVNFNDKAQFGNAISSSEKLVFESSVTFDNCTFNDFADFSKVRFESAVTFDNVSFKGDADFSNAKFYSALSFINCHFNTCSKLDFTNATINSLNFQYDTSLPGALIFNKTKIKNIAKIEHLAKNEPIIENTNQKPEPNNKSLNCKIYLNNSCIDKFSFFYHDFLLCFDTDDRIYKHRVYNQLLNKFKVEGMSFCYEQLDKEYNAAKYRKLDKYIFDGYSDDHSFKWWGAMIDNIDNYWWGYKYEKERIIFWTLILFIVFYLINIKAWRFIYGKVYLLDGLDEECNHYKKIESNKKEIFYKPVQKRKKRKKRGKTTLSKLLLPLHYTAITFFSLSIKFNKVKYEENISGWRGILGLFFVLVIHFTGLVCIAFMVNYALSDGVKFLSPF